MKSRVLGPPWWSSGQQSTLPLWGELVQVPSLVGELKSHMPPGAAKKKKESLSFNNQLFTWTQEILLPVLEVKV